MKTISVQDLKQHLEKKDVQLIDVREPAEHRSEAIEGARLIPLGKIKVDYLTDRSQKTVIYCRSGKRSLDSCEKLLAEDASLDLYSLEGGILAWQAAGHPIKKTGPSVLPVDRQTQVVIGLSTLSGTLLGTFYHSGFYVLPGFMGLGLIFAGLSGWCGMAKLLAKMPWNK